MNRCHEKTSGRFCGDESETTGETTPDGHPIRRDRSGARVYPHEGRDLKMSPADKAHARWINAHSGKNLPPEEQAAEQRHRDRMVKKHGRGLLGRKTALEVEYDAVVEELLRETWSDAARLGALCVRTRKPEYCAAAKKAGVGAAKGTADKVGRALGFVHDRNPKVEAEQARQKAANQRTSDETRNLDDRITAEKRRLGINTYWGSLPKGHALEKERLARDARLHAADEEETFRHLPRDRRNRKKRNFNVPVAMARWSGT